MGFGSGLRYRNYNSLCGNPGETDWTKNINNMWIEVHRENGEIVAVFGYYQI